MAPTEYRVIAKRATLSRADRPARRRRRRRAARPGHAGRLARGDEPVDPRRLRPDGDRSADRHAARRPGPPGLDGRPAPRRAARRRRRRELVADPASIPTFFLRYLGDDPLPDEPWRTGDRVTRDEQGFLHFVGRTDDVIISAGYRIGPFEVESALGSHAAVAEAAVVGAPDDERGSVVRAVVVLTRRLRAVRRARRRAPGTRQGPDRAVQVPAPRRLRRRAAADAERQGPPRGAARGVTRPLRRTSTAALRERVRPPATPSVRLRRSQADKLDTRRARGRNPAALPSRG